MNPIQDSLDVQGAMFHIMQEGRLFHWQLEGDYA